MKPAVLRGHNACLPQAFYWPNVHAGMVFCDWSCSASVNLRPAKLEENYRNGWSQETYRFSGGVKAARWPGHFKEMFRANHYIRTIFRLNIYIASTHVEAESNEWIPVRRLRPVALLSCLSSKVPYVYTYTCTVLLYHIYVPEGTKVLYTYCIETPPPWSELERQIILFILFISFSRILLLAGFEPMTFSFTVRIFFPLVITH